MSNIAALSLLTKYDETTQGTPPADAAAWIAGGIRLRHIAESVDMSGVERVLLEDVRNQSRIWANEARVKGIDNPEFPISVYGHGLGGTTAGAAQAATTLPGYELANLLGNTLGGISRGFSTDIADGSSTTTVIAVTSAALYEAGDFVAVNFATAVSGYPVTTCWPRRVIDTDSVSSPNTLTLDQALPAAPAAADLVHACIVVYVDEDILCDSNAAAGPYTRSYLVQKGMPGAGATVRESWMFRGCVETLQAFSLTRGEVMTFAMQVMAGSHADPTSAPWPTAWSANAELGLAPLSIGPLTEVWLVDDGASTNTNIQVSRFDVEPGVPRIRTEVLTSTGQNMDATAGYAAEPAETTVNLRIDPLTIAQWTDQDAETQKTLRWSRLGPVGSGVAVHFPRVSHMATPKRDINNATTGTGVMFLAHEDEDLGTMPANANRWRSKMQLVFF